MGQPRFTEDFKTDAIKQITEREHSIADVSQRLGISTHLFYAWIKRHASFAWLRGKARPVSGDQAAEAGVGACHGGA